jgi:hypothetical protein
MQYRHVRLWLRALPEEPDLRYSTPCPAAGGKRASRRPALQTTIRARVGEGRYGRERGDLGRTPTLQRRACTDNAREPPVDGSTGRERCGRAPGPRPGERHRGAGGTGASGAGTGATRRCGQLPFTGADVRRLAATGGQGNRHRLRSRRRRAFHASPSSAPRARRRSPKRRNRSIAAGTSRAIAWEDPA